MADAGYKEVNAALSKLEKRIHDVYTEAYASIQAKTEDYFRRFEAKNKIKKAKVQAGKMTQQEYDEWRKNQLLVGDRWEDMSDVIAKDLSHANQIAMSMANEFTYDAYAMGRNYGYYSTFIYGEDVVNHMGRSFTLYDKRTVGRLARDNPQLLPSLPPEKLINIPKDKLWNKQKMTSQLLQGILTGDGPKELAARLRKVTDMDEVASLRNARTMAIGAQNAGRRDSYKAAVAAGLNIRQQWLSTIDERTRDSHRHMDGEIIKVGDKWHHYTFSNGCRFPGDPEGPPHEVYNCRCTLVPIIGNMDSDVSDLSKRAHDASVLSYEGWKNAQPKPQPEIVLVEAQIDALQPKLSTAKEAVDAFPTKTYSGIWKDDVTTADYDNKMSSIQAKRDYFEAKLAAEPDNPKWQQKLNELTEFESEGKKYSALYAKYNQSKKEMDALQSKLRSLKNPGKAGAPDDRFSEERKSNALRYGTQDKAVADAIFRPECGDLWRTLTPSEKSAAYSYTSGSGPFNRPLRGYDRSWDNFKGVGNVPLNNEYAGKEIALLTSVIDRSPTSHDMWLGRGVSDSGMAGFLQVSEAFLRSATQDELTAALVGKVVTDEAFLSCGTVFGAGFGTNVRLYVPKGTKALYCEPFSAYSGEGGKSWDGKTGATYFGHEFETLLQRKSQYRVAKVTKVGGKVEIEVDVLGDMAMLE